MKLLDIERLTQIIEAEVRKALAEVDESQNPPRQVDLPAPRAQVNAGRSRQAGQKKVLAVFTSDCKCSLDQAPDSRLHKPPCQNTAITQVEQLAAAGYNVTAALPPIAVELSMDKRVENIKGIGAVLTGGFAADISNMVKEAEVIVIPLLSRTAAAKLALGIADDPALMIVMQGLITGKPVIAAKNAADPEGANCPNLSTEKTPPALIQLAKNYLKTLADFGMKLIDISQLADAVMNKPVTHIQIPNNNGKPLITKSVIAALAEDVKVFTIPNPAIVTPLAYDLAKERGIKIVAAQS